MVHNCNNYLLVILINYRTNKMGNVTEIMISDSVDINIDFDIIVVNTGHLSGAISVLGYVSSNVR